MHPRWTRLVAVAVGLALAAAPKSQQSQSRVSADRLVAHARALIAHESGEPVPYLLKALRVRTAEGDLTRVDEVLRFLAVHARDSGDAYQWGERIVALDIRRRVPEPQLARDLLDLGRQYRYALRRQDAAECLDKAERIARGQGDLGLLANILVQRANLASDEGRFMQAAMFLESANEVFERVESVTWQHAQVLAELGQLQADSGQLLDAWQSFARAEEIAFRCLPECAQFWHWKKTNDSALMASAGRARILAAFGRFEDAIREGQNARRLALRSNLGDRRYIILAEMAEWAPRAGRPDLAERWYELALRVGDPAGRIPVRLAYASYLIETGRDADALLLLSEVPSDATPQHHVERLLLTGRASLARSDNHTAIGLYGKALTTAQECVSPPSLLWQAHTGLGEALIRLRRLKEGTSELEAAVQVVRDWAGGVLDPALAYEDGPKSPWHAYGQLIVNYVRQNRTIEALGLSEEMKGLASMADRADEGLLQPVAEPLRSQFDRTRMAIASARRALHENRFGDARDRASATAELQLLDNELLRLISQREHTDSDSPDMLVRAARRLASEQDCALVSYCLSGSDGVAFVITARGLQAKRLTVSKEQILSLAGLIRNYRLSPEDAWKSDPAPQLLRSLHNTLIEPVESEVRGVRKLVIVPDGALWSLPFEMLWQSEGTKRQYLIERYAISYAPSVRAAVEWASRPRRTSAVATADVRVVANGVAKNESPRELSPRQVSVATRDAEIVRQALGDRVRIAQGSAATKATMMRALAEADVLHVAAHGTYTDDYPPASYISLASRGQAASSGVLRGWEIASVKCRASLVFLAACDTGRTSSVRGRGLLGLTGAVMAAGARACIGSRWADRDAATEVYLARFYQYYSRSNDAADAARRAACDLIAAGAPPYDWAAFMVLGG